MAAMIHAPRKYHHLVAEQPEPATPASPAKTNLLGSWYITRSSSPFWIDKRNPTITLAADSKTDDGTRAPETLPLSALYQTAGPAPVLANQTSYQTLASSKVKTTAGMDRPVDGSSSFWGESGGSGGGEGPIQMEWRGSGWLRMVSARWEILGWGGEGEAEADEWLLVFADKSMFTPAGISLYTRRRTGVEDMEWAGIEEGLRRLVERYPEEGELRELALGMRVVRHD
ncbi:hypothetical protein P170DRAFT_514540 [Aspergillus steynii IBT 23096]|uniref:Uncharacterized protein n=1 Tax=Aspergillus steynii IBT 23096 TaxID=1392250 RepID=A0A2I2FRM1_9EURO|nr:uncharacterized protein P170DRAFT_514540 [Aspergillus steynii IBT 23096]PLB43280.1 hypothetical protein P170DRAFT_514540 [Aspergillus steynii IBT 23096]